jgi:hypothetical protein
MGMALSRHHRGPIQKDLPQSLAEILTQGRRRSSGGLGAIRRWCAEAFPSSGKLWKRQVLLPRLSGVCHNLVKRLESQHESCYGRVIKELRPASSCRRDEVAGLIQQLSHLRVA